MNGTELTFWHEVAIGVISILLTIAGWMWTTTVKTVLSLRTEFAAHVVDDAKAFGAIRLDMAEKHTEIIKELQAPTRIVKRRR